MNSRLPASTVAEVPSVVGMFPTTTIPDLRATRAVVRPRRPREGGPWKKSEVLPEGDTETIVRPVPCLPEEALKLLTRMSPGRVLPPDGNPAGTIATPYGLPSPLPGTVPALTEGVWASEARKEPEDRLWACTWPARVTPISRAGVNAAMKSL